MIGLIATHDSSLITTTPCKCQNGRDLGSFDFIYSIKKLPQVRDDDDVVLVAVEQKRAVLDARLELDSDFGKTDFALGIVIRILCPYHLGFVPIFFLHNFINPEDF